MIVLDTHAVIWLLMAPDRISPAAGRAIRAARFSGEALGCSPVSFFEIADAVRRDRLHLYTSIEEFIAAIQKWLIAIPLTAEIAICAGALPDTFHGDPMDRIIAATAVAGGHTLITRDERIRRAKACKTIW